MKKRTNELYDMYKVIERRKKENEQKRKEMIEEKERMLCTFRPEVGRLNDEMFRNRPDNVSLFYNDGYVNRMNKVRREKVLREIEENFKMEKKNYVTIPKEFKLRTGNSVNKNNAVIFSERNSLYNKNINSIRNSVTTNNNEYNKLEHKFSLEEICNYYNTNNPHLHSLPYSKAKEKLHLLLHQN